MHPPTALMQALQPTAAPLQWQPCQVFAARLALTTHARDCSEGTPGSLGQDQQPARIAHANMPTNMSAAGAETASQVICC